MISGECLLKPRLVPSVLRSLMAVTIHGLALGISQEEVTELSWQKYTSIRQIHFSGLSFHGYAPSIGHYRY